MEIVNNLIREKLPELKDASGLKGPVKDRHQDPFLSNCRTLETDAILKVFRGLNKQTRGRTGRVNERKEQEKQTYTQLTHDIRGIEAASDRLESGRANACNDAVSHPAFFAQAKNQTSTWGN